MRTWLRGKVTLLFLTLAVVLAIPAVALADTTIADGDGVLPAGDNNMNITGTVPCNSPTIKTAPVVVNRNGAAGSTNVFANSSTITVSVLSTSGNLTATVPSGSNTIALPSDWGSKPNNTQSASVTSTVTVTPTVSGAGSGSVTYRATGQNSSGATINRDDTMNVSWTAGSCDSTPPVITPNIAGTLGDDGWYTSDVTLTWSVTDPESTVASTTGCGTTNITADQNATTYTCSATSAGGTSSQSVSIKRDATAPTSVATTLDDGPDHNGWYNNPVGWTTTGTDGTSGIASCDSGTYSGPDSATASVSGKCTDNAGNASNAAVSAAFQYDATKPELNPSVSPNPVTQNGSATASAGASDNLSGVASSSCDPVVTSTIGDHTVSCSATDNAGNSNTASASYHVNYNWNGFFRPVDNPDVALNTVKAGQSIPVKFSLSGNQGLSIFAASSPASQKVVCDAGADIDPLEELATAGSSGLSYDASIDQYNYVWKSDKAWAGTCRKLSVTLIDGTVHTANFKFLK